MKQRIWPSIMAKNQKELNADFKRLKGVVKKLHIDVVDGRFAANKAMWFPFRLRKGFFYNAHLMVKKPEKWIRKNWGRAEIFIPQFEEVENKEGYIAWMKKRGKKVAFAIKPGTKVEKLNNYLGLMDYILILTVEPGFYGSKFLPSCLKKIKQVKKINPKIKVIVDGGMNPKTIGKAARLGGDFFVSGSFVSKAKEPKKAMAELKKVI